MHIVLKNKLNIKLLSRRNTVVLNTYNRQMTINLESNYETLIFLIFFSLLLKIYNTLT